MLIKKGQTHIVQEIKIFYLAKLQSTFNNFLYLYLQLLKAKFILTSISTF